MKKLTLQQALEKPLVKQLMKEVLLETRNPYDKDKMKRRVIKFVKYHMKYPQIWRAFKSKGQELWESGCRHFGSAAIIQSIRFDTAVQTGGDFKINNNYSPFYARMFEIKYPATKGFFEKRGLK